MTVPPAPRNARSPPSPRRCLPLPGLHPMPAAIPTPHTTTPTHAEPALRCRRRHLKPHTPRIFPPPPLAHGPLTRTRTVHHSPPVTNRPIYAGIAPAEVADAGCRSYLLSPEHFLTKLPFPVVDRAHPTFRAGGFLHEPDAFPGALVQQSYWRGRTWIHGDCWLLGALWQSGFQAEADLIADRILEAVGRSEGIYECYDSLTGFGNGHPEFMWSAAAVLMVACRFYARPPVAQLRG
jgi:hypothetical protein